MKEKDIEKTFKSYESHARKTKLLREGKKRIKAIHMAPGSVNSPHVDEVIHPTDKTNRKKP